MQTTTLQYWRVEYTENGTHKHGEYSPQDGDVKPDCPYIRELIAEELMWPIDEPDRSIAYSQSRPRVPMTNRTRVAC